jgi:hypothetical protein
MKREWVISIREQCRRQGVAFFFKQWGGVRKAKNGRLLDGRTYDEYPLRVLKPVPERAYCIAWAVEFGKSLFVARSFEGHQRAIRDERNGKSYEPGIVV